MTSGIPLALLSRGIHLNTCPRARDTGGSSGPRSIGQADAPSALGAIATILLRNRLRRDEDCSVLCATHKAETRFGFNYLQFMGLYSKFPELAFNQWGTSSSPAQLMSLTTDSKWKLWRRHTYESLNNRNQHLEPAHLFASAGMFPGVDSDRGRIRNRDRRRISAPQPEIGPGRRTITQSEIPAYC